MIGAPERILLKGHTISDKRRRALMLEYNVGIRVKKDKIIIKENGEAVNEVKKLINTE